MILVMMDAFIANGIVRRLCAKVEIWLREISQQHPTFGFLFANFWFGAKPSWIGFVPPTKSHCPMAG
jgi:hypothetical protein